jgi:hypothetical protein
VYPPNAAGSLELPDVPTELLRVFRIHGSEVYAFAVALTADPASAEAAARDAFVGWWQDSARSVDEGDSLRMHLIGRVYRAARPLRCPPESSSARPGRRRRRGVEAG